MLHASPPIGEVSFRPPTPVRPGTAVGDAARFGLQAVQFTPGLPRRRPGRRRRRGLPHPRQSL
ncbi:hypothetical protein FGD71_015485 [Streptomyces sporangiiformans]|uniref:Uncharacterized protein n=1 Tax=Streptomyces sporangiiformans TaxID=2315329 RepID=A0A505DN53_9ACTN|nr:hypothetical protein FGD71_015485 [Streptomyces sporangiiformans]